MIIISMTTRLVVTVKEEYQHYPHPHPHPHPHHFAVEM